MRLPLGVLILLGAALGACEMETATETGATPPTRTVTARALTPLPTPVSVALPPCTWALVERVVDGDTVVVAYGERSERVRYIGVDTPETVAPGTPVQAFGPQASARNKQLVEGKQVCLERDVSERDRFGRLLRYAWLPDGTMVNEALVEAGLATVVTFPPDVKYHRERLLPAQASARDAGRGIWSD